MTYIEDTILVDKDVYGILASKGIAEAQYKLATMYEQGIKSNNNLYANILEAIYWYEEATSQNIFQLTII